jgi:hypothetical protein
MDESLARCAIEDLHGLKLYFGRRASSSGLLECRAERRALSTIPHRSRAGLTHVLLRGSDIRHKNLEVVIQSARYRRAEPGVYRAT